MAALNRPSTASYEIHESVQVDTADNEDHTFCGIAFPVKVHKYLPIERLEIHSVSVRGRLGETSRGAPLGEVSVWVSRDTPTNATRFRMSPANWEKIYQNKDKASPREYAVLRLDQPIVMRPGQLRMIYIHSSAPSDEAIVYDNSEFHINSRYTDDFLSILSGKAHLSPTPFGTVPIWGWGNAWRDRREFVGQLQYGVTFKLWNPNTHQRFGGNFDAAVQSLLLCQRNDSSPMARLPDECIYYILNMCKWDWFNDDGQNLKTRYRVRKRRAIAEGNHENMDDGADDADGDVAMEEDEEVQDEVLEEDVEEMEDEEENEDDDEDSEDDQMDFFREERRNPLFFEVDAASSDEEDHQQQQVPNPHRHVGGGWFRRHFARIHVFGAQQDDSDDDDDDDDDDDSDFVESGTVGSTT